MRYDLSMELCKAGKHLFFLCALLQQINAQAANGPGPRSGHLFWYDAARQKTMLYGGSTATNTSEADTWEFDGLAWSRVAVNGFSPATEVIRIGEYDFARQRFVAFRTVFANPSLQMWEWDGASWTQRMFGGWPGNISPYSASLAYNDALGKVVAFGGNDGTIVPVYYNEIYAWDGAAWVHLPAANKPTPRAYSKVAFDVVRNELVMFGGRTSPTGFGGIDLNDTWTLNGGVWSQKSPQVNPPYDINGRLIRVDGSGGLCLIQGDGRLWNWNGSEWNARTSPFYPAPRSGFGVAFDPLRNDVILYGGSGQGGVIYDDAWRLGASGWSSIPQTVVQSSSSGNLFTLSPPLMWADAQAFAVSLGGSLATLKRQADHDQVQQMFGQRSVWIGLNDLASNGNYEWASGAPESYRNWALGQPDNPTANSVVCMDPNFGMHWNDVPENGYREGLVEIPFGSTSHALGAPSNAGSPPGQIAGHSMASMSTGGVILFGGASSSGPNPFTFTLLNSSWTQQFSLLNPTFRTDATLVLDSVRQNNVLFGGRNPLGAALSDTWTWIAGQWAFVPLAISPSARYSHKMAFDAKRGVGVMFGGKDAAGNALGDTWIWDGTSWMHVNASVSPPARFDHGLAYDLRRDRIICFGGEGAAGFLDDVWEWDGTTWQQVPRQVRNGFTWGPAPRARHAMTYDVLAERVVIYGGDVASGCESDIWSWDGVVWTKCYLEGASSPTARSRSQLVVFANAGGLLMLGGASAGVFLGDGWMLELPVLARLSAYGSGCSGTQGVPVLGASNGSLPLIGQTFLLRISNIPSTPFNLPFGVFDLQRNTFAGLQVPVDLGFAGLPGCQALTGAYWSYTLSPATAANSVAWPLAIPNINGLLGQSLYLQAAILDNFGGRFASLTNGVEARVGNR